MTTAVEVAEKGHQLAAWVNFDGTLAMTENSSYGPDAPPADFSSPNPIRAAYNVDYIIDRGTGVYEIHFANAMPNANYSFTGAISNTNTSWAGTFAGSSRGVGGVQQEGSVAPSTSSLRIETLYGSNASANGTNADFSSVSLMVFRLPQEIQ